MGFLWIFGIFVDFWDFYWIFGIFIGFFGFLLDFWDFYWIFLWIFIGFMRIQWNGIFIGLLVRYIKTLRKSP